MVETFMAGLVPVADSFVSPRRPEFRDVQTSIVSYSYDPQQAIQLMQGLGYGRDAEGSLRTGSGQPLTFELCGTIRCHWSV